MEVESKRKYCKQPQPITRHFDPNVSQHRLSFILTNILKWANGTEIKYFFIEGDEPQKEVVRHAFKLWKDIGIGISFKEVSIADEALVRIGFDFSDGSWSYVGRDILTISKSQRTMNFGWDLTADSYGLTTALHEIGHAIGFQHEHQSPFAGIVWNTQAVYEEFSGSPNNWSASQIESNIINKQPANQLLGSTWDPDSIMEYEFRPGLVLQPKPYDTKGIFPPGTLSAKDINGVKSVYPLIKQTSFIKLTPNKSEAIIAKSGQQSDFIFTPPSTKKYTFQTVGELDTVMVISEQSETENYYLAGDDDSGFEKNAKIKLSLIKGRNYLINVRVVFAPSEQNGSIIVL